MSKRLSKSRFVRKLRNEATPAEVRFREILREYGISEHVKDQYVLGPYIVDFCHVKERVVVEIDGSSHKGREGYDAIRTDRLYDYGYRVIRFTNEQVLGDAAPLLATLQRAIALPKLRETRSPGYVAPTWKKMQKHVQYESKKHRLDGKSLKVFRGPRRNALIANPSVIGKVVYVPPPKP